MAAVSRNIEVLADCRADDLPLEQLLGRGEPVVLKGLVSEWGLVRAGLESDEAAIRYLRLHYNGKPVGYSYGEPEIRGRPFYTQDFSALNCIVKRDRLDEVLSQIEQHLHDELPPTYYVASLLIDNCLPSFRKENDLGFAAAGLDVPPTIWIGNRTIASCHYDAPNNLACCAVGRRRITVFPPEQIHNLYPGPLEPTPGGQAVSVVDLTDPDLARYPRFEQALAAGQTAVLEPGDAIFVPSMWWHHVEGLSAFNTLVNYWWTSVPAHIPTPMNALYHAMWTIRDRPEREKNAWREVFEHYVFGPAQRAGEHLPEAARGVLAPMDETQARQIRAMLLNKLNR